MSVDRKTPIDAIVSEWAWSPRPAYFSPTLYPIGGIVEVEEGPKKASASEPAQGMSTESSVPRC
ncbi:MAG: hypothetical protein K8R36_13965 [Planctomycetales bacterium]|nr:hypothetical protein [Planctomycetales bacterium]